MAMPTIILNQSGAGASTFWTPDYFKDVFNVGLQAVVTGSISSAAIEYTLDDTTAQGYDASTGNWFQVPGFTSVTASAAGSMTIPCRGIRIKITTGTGSIALSIQQAGTR